MLEYTRGLKDLHNLIGINTSCETVHRTALALANHRSRLEIILSSAPKYLSLLLVLPFPATLVDFRLSAQTANVTASAGWTWSWTLINCVC